MIKNNQNLFALPVPATFLVAKVDSGLKQVLYSKELRHAEEVRLGQRKVHDLIVHICKENQSYKSVSPGLCGFFFVAKYVGFCCGCIFFLPNLNCNLQIFVLFGSKEFKDTIFISEH